MRLLVTLLAASTAALAAFFVFPAASTPGVYAAECNPERPHEAGDYSGSVPSGGEERTYLLHVPPGYDGSQPTPIVLSFHGLGGTSEQQLEYTGSAETADREGFILVMPQGRQAENVSLTHWNVVLSELPDEADDVGFTSDLIDALSEELCVDQNRIFATGLSNGAQMVTRLACNLSERIAAVAPVSGLYYPPLADELQDSVGCEPVRAVPIVSFHGTDDPIIGFDGGRPVLAGFAIPLNFRDIDDAVLPDWAASRGCDPEPVVEGVTDTVDVWRYQNCAEDAVIELYVIDGGGHTWPNAAREPVPETLGQTNRDIDANDIMWEFFEAHPLDAGSGGGGGFETWWAIAIAGGVAGLVIVGGGAFVVRRR